MEPLTAVLAWKCGRPVKLALTRAQMYGPVGHRGRTWQALRLGVGGEGRLTAIHHHCIAATSSFEDFLEPAANASLHAYASPAILTETEGLRLEYVHVYVDDQARLGPRHRRNEGRCLSAAEGGHRHIKGLGSRWVGGEMSP